MTNKLINTLLVMYFAVFLWSPLMAYGQIIDGWCPFNPVAMLTGLGIWFLLDDIADYQRSPAPRPVIYGAFLAPFWPFLRRFIHKN